MRKMLIQSAEPKHSGIYSCEAVDDRIAFKVDVAGDFESTYFFSKPLTKCQITLHPLHAVCPFASFYFDKISFHNQIIKPPFY